ncbi:O-antigen ligase-like membrane protein [Vibrio crassostreae]|uniref:O-antigen ligase-related domain-containing protein n=2 Tax=Vibrio crassostreae TaxID=246167 RepID=A0A822N6J6_9VIBR|nr:O-antigen ligase-like membrane protein [Vibrio crassostreae]TCN07167.1 O-antigen ligase-like membrane protein [Vibrio crassostreae]TCU07545.1 O-antigen ligase-like membrane protein [Vibrio crassostreae]CAK2209563.1 O-antigen ligase-like membrane protein [Vibrio crassostreae]CAK2209894.1 O-antigen ligase-like membrane protein [Vibrio crassostreae]
MTNYVSSNSKAWLTVFLILILFKPTPSVLLGSEIGMKIPDLIFITFLSLYLLIENKKIKINNMLVFLFVIFVFEITSQFNGMIYGNNILINDFVDLLLPLEVTLGFLVGCVYFASNENAKIRSIDRKIIILFILFSFIIFFDPLSIKSVLSNFYELGKSRGHSEENVSNIWRLSSTFTNPNYFGFFCSVVAAYYLYKNIESLSFFNVMMFIAFSIFVFISGSRTSLISMLLAFTSVIFIDFYTKGVGTKGRVVFYTTLSILIIFLVPKAVDLVGEILWRFTNVDNMKESFGARLGAWESTFVSIQQHALIGVGSNKMEVKSIDSNYVLILYKNGLVGLFLKLAFLTYMLKMSVTNIKKNINNDKGRSAINMLSVISIIVTTIAMITAIPLSMVHLAVPQSVIFGYVYQEYRYWGRCGC